MLVAVPMPGADSNIAVSVNIGSLCFAAAFGADHATCNPVQIAVFIDVRERNPVHSAADFSDLVIFDLRDTGKGRRAKQANQRNNNGQTMNATKFMRKNIKFLLI